MALVELKLLFKKGGCMCRYKPNKMVKTELDFCRTNCNFTDQELKYFNLKAKDTSNIKIALELNVAYSTVSKIAHNVDEKIERAKRYVKNI